MFFNASNNLGDLGDLGDDLQTRPRVVGSGSFWDRGWGDLITQSTNTVRDIFAARYQSRTPQAPQITTLPQTFVPPGSNPNPSLNNEPGQLDIFGTKIGYGTLILVGLGFFLLQSRPLTKR